MPQNPLELLQDTEEMLSRLIMTHIDDAHYCRVCSEIRCMIGELFMMMDEEISV